MPPLLFFYWSFRKNTRIQNSVLLIGSLVFYASYGKRGSVVLLACILLTYFGGKVVANQKNYTYVFVVLNVLILLGFKYGTRMFQNSGWVMPLGLSFYILQSTGYLLDIANGKSEAEINIVDYALFVSFFPTIVSGPILKSRQYLPKIKSSKTISYDSFLSSLLVFLYGLFLKMVVADRLALFTGPVFQNYADYEGGIVFLSAILYSLEIYCDFFGYTCMVSAIAGLFGYTLPDNFRQPYFSKTINEFWKRWHMSLTSWLTEYIYFPLGGNRKGTARKHLNILIIFVISALWHGTGNHFLIWGILHAFYRIFGEITMNLRYKFTEFLHIDRNKAGYQFLQQLFIFGLVTFAWIFFRADSVSSAIGFIDRILMDFHVHVFFDGSIYQFAVDEIHFHVLFIALEVVLLVSCFREKGKTASSIVNENLVIRWSVLLLLLFTILIAGVYGPSYNAGNFIYANF